MVGMYFVLGVLAPSILNLIHLVMNVYIVVARGNIMSLGFSGISFLTKTIGMSVSYTHLTLPTKA